MKFNKTALLVVTLFLALPSSAICKEPKKAVQIFNFYKIHEIKQGNLEGENFYTEGFVAKIYTCPPCPADAQCKPCMRENIVISENNVLIEAYYLTEKDLIIFTENSKNLKLGKKYKFLIKMTGRKTTSESINDIELVDYKLLK